MNGSGEIDTSEPRSWEGLPRASAARPEDSASSSTRRKHAAHGKLAPVPQRAYSKCRGRAALVSICTYASSRSSSLRRSSARLALALAAGLLACRQHAEQVPADKQAPATEPARKAPEPPEPEPPEPQELPSLMKDHFGVATQARDAVVRGRLEQAEGSLTWLGQHTAARDMPAAWQPYVERMQQAARKAKAESTLAAAGRAIADTAAECGACHAALHQGPEFAADAREKPGAAVPPSTQRAELRERMHEHASAIERLWQGLIGPSDRAWREGAESLSVLHDHGHVPIARLARLGSIRALGERAGNLPSAPERAALYGRILAECGDCHASAAVDPGALERPSAAPRSQ